MAYDPNVLRRASARLEEPGMAVDLGAVAKGFAAQRAADDQNYQCDGQCTDRSQSDGDVAFGRGEVAVGNVKDGEDQHERGDDFTQQVRCRLADRGCRAEDAADGVGVLLQIEMRAIEEPCEQCTRRPAGHLCDHVARDIAPRKLACRGEGQRDRGVEMCAAVRSGDHYAGEDGHRPSDDDDDPSRSVAFGTCQQNVCADAGAQEQHHGGSDKFGKNRCHSRSVLSFLFCPAQAAAHGFVP